MGDDARRRGRSRAASAWRRRPSAARRGSRRRRAPARGCRPAPRPGRGAPAQPASTRREREAAAAAAAPSRARPCSYPTRRIGGVISSHELAAEALQAAADPAGDGPRRDPERGRDRAVRLVLEKKRSRMSAQPGGRRVRACRTASASSRSVRRSSRSVTVASESSSCAWARRRWSVHRLRVTCAIQPRSASSSRSVSSRSNTRAKTSWNTSSASLSDSRYPRRMIA